jgi:hypothetical protein
VRAGLDGEPIALPALTFVPAPEASPNPQRHGQPRPDASWTEARETIDALGAALAPQLPFANARQRELAMTADEGLRHLHITGDAMLWLRETLTCRASLVRTTDRIELRDHRARACRARNGLRCVQRPLELSVGSHRCLHWSAWGQVAK